MSIAGARKIAGGFGVLALVAFVAILLLASLKWRPANDAARLVTGWWVGGWEWFGQTLPGLATSVDGQTWLPLVVALAVGGVVGVLLRNRPNAWLYSAVIGFLVALFLYVPAAGVKLADFAVWAGHQFDKFRAGML